MRLTTIDHIGVSHRPGAAAAPVTATGQTPEAWTLSRGAA